MLLYVNKKEQKRKKIKRFTILFSIIILLLLNYFHFFKALHTTTSQLIAYKQPYTQPYLSDTSDTVTYFKSKIDNNPYAILVPKKLNRNNIQSLAYVFTKLPKDSTVTLTKEVSSPQLIQDIAKAHLSDITAISSSTAIIITTDLSNILPEIETKQLIPTSVSPTKIKLLPAAIDILNQYFPLPNEPIKTIDKEKLALEQFATKYKSVIQTIIQTNDSTPNILIDNYILQNASICLQTENDVACTINKKNSLQKNISLTKRKLSSKDSYERLLLLTSIFPITEYANPESDEGLLFKFGLRKSILLPSEILKYKKSENLLRKLKQKAGFNPDYNNDSMKFYKFKIVEIDLNDNI